MEPEFRSEIVTLLQWAIVVALVMLGLAIALEMMMWRRLFKLVESLKLQARSILVPPDFRPAMNGESPDSAVKVGETGAFVEVFKSGTRAHGCLLCGNTNLRKVRPDESDDPIRVLLCPKCMHQFAMEGEKMTITKYEPEAVRDA